MTYFVRKSGLPVADRYLAYSGAPLTFGSRELVLEVGFVAARIRLFNLMHRTWLTDVNGFVGILAVLPVPGGEDLLPAPRMVQVRLREPMTGAGMVMLPISLELEGRSLPLPVLELGLTLRAGRSGNTYIRLNGAVQPPFASAGPVAFDASPTQRAIAAAADTWLTRVAEIVSSPPNLSGQRGREI